MKEKPAFPEFLLREKYPDDKDMEEINFCRQMYKNISNSLVEREKYQVLLRKHILGRYPSKSEKHYIYAYMKNYYKRYRTVTMVLRYGSFTAAIILLTLSFVLNTPIVARIVMIFGGFLLLLWYVFFYSLDIKVWEILRDIKKGNYKIYQGFLCDVKDSENPDKKKVTFRRGDNLPIVLNQDIPEAGAEENAVAICVRLDDKKFSDKEGFCKIFTKYMLEEGIQKVSQEINTVGLFKLEKGVEKE